MDIKKAQKTIEKLLRLADNNPNEMEAAAAAEKAAEIALRYGIQLSQVNTDEDKVEYTRCTVYSTPRFHHWVASLAAGLSHLHACKYYYSEAYKEGTYKPKCDYVFVGRPLSQQAAKQSMEYLTETINRLNKEAVKGKGMSQRERSAFRKSFKIGAASRIRERLFQRTRDLKRDNEKAQEATGSTALVVADYYDTEREAIKKWLEDDGMTFTSRKGSGVSISEDAYNAGRAAGETVGLDPQLR